MSEALWGAKLCSRAACGGKNEMVWRCGGVELHLSETVGHVKRVEVHNLL